LLGSLGGNGGSSTGGGPGSLLQGASGLISSMGNMLMKSITLKSTSIKELKPEVRQNAKRIQIKYGPFKIKGRQSKVRIYF
jgi:hypothetical protein